MALLDEWDSMHHAKEIHKAYNSGFERGSQTYRKYDTFNMFRPLAIAAIGGLHLSYDGSIAYDSFETQDQPGKHQT